MSISSEQDSGFYGFHDVSSQWNRGDQAIATGLNVMNSLSYIPGISVIVGIARIIFAAMWMSEEKNEDLRKALGMQILRGFVEILCVGIFYSIPDLIFTANRFGCCARDDSDQNHNFQATQVYL